MKLCTRTGLGNATSVGYPVELVGIRKTVLKGPIFLQDKSVYTKATGKKSGQTKVE